MKILKKSLSIILCIATIFSCVAFVASAAKKTDEKLPQIYVNGFGSRYLYYKDDPEKTSLFFPVNTDLMFANLTNFTKYAGDSIKKGDYNLIYNHLYNAFWDTFGMTILEGDGITNANDNVVCEPTELSYDGNGIYDFKYDSRLSPIDLADQLQSYIKKVQKHSGSKRFELVGASYGGDIVMAYLNEYPKMHKYIDSVVLSVPSYGGFSVVGELFSGNFHIDHNTLTEYAFVGINNEDLGLFLSVLNKSGFLKIFLEMLAIPAVKAIAIEAATDVMRDIFAKIPCMWTFVQEEYFYDAMVNLFGENYADPDHEYAEHIRKVIYYQENIMQRLDEVYRTAARNDIKMNIICKYGRPPMPISRKGSFMSDGAVDVTDVTMGAVASKYGEVLPDDYQQVRYTKRNFISPDNCIDASAGVDPYNTWYVKHLEHTEKNAGFVDLINAIVYEDLHVFKNPKYPQFLEPTPDGGLTPVTGPDEKAETSLIEDTVALTKRLIELASTAIKGLFNK